MKPTDAGEVAAERLLELHVGLPGARDLEVRIDTAHGDCIASVPVPAGVRERRRAGRACR